jgi:hypothetical protein
LDGVRLFLALIYSALTPVAALAFALGMSAQGRGLRPFKRPWLLSTLLGVQTVSLIFALVVLASADRRPTGDNCFDSQTIELLWLIFFLACFAGGAAIAGASLTGIPAGAKRLGRAHG